ncbi:MAG: thiol reductant ABC exporter subunit CydD [Lapillicoccus sp.]
MTRGPVDPRLLRVLPDARRPLVELGVAGVMQGAATVAGAFAVAGLVAAVVLGRDLLAPVLAVAVVFGVRAGVASAVERGAARAGALVSARLRRLLLAAWLTRPSEAAVDPARGTTLAAQGVTSVETYVTRYLPAMVHAGVVPALAVVALAVVDWPSAVVVVLTLPLLPLFAALIGRTTQEATERRWAALEALSGHFLDVVRGLPTLVTYGRGMRQVETVRATSERHRAETMATLRIAFLSSTALELLATLSVALVAVGVGLRLAGGSLDLQTGLVAILLAPEAFWPIRRVGVEFHAAADGAQALEAILRELDGPAPATSPTGPPTRPSPRLSGFALDRVGYCYPGCAESILTSVTVAAQTGLVVVTGPSGCGKTTLLELVAGVRCPTSGAVAAERAHLVTQRPFLLAATLRDNLVLAAPEPPSRATLWDALRAVGLDGVVAGLPDGLETWLGDDGFGLSAGQRARLAVARAILSEASLVLLDEPTAHLDAAGVETLHTVISDLARTRTVVATTHRPELVSIADALVDLTPVGSRR